MIKDLRFEEFLTRNNIDNETWDKAEIDWPTLQAIAIHHENEYPTLESSAEFFANVIQKFSAVHSVRWRVKDPEHLASKIVRKRSDKTAKYADISSENYHEIVTDLVGIRALHLFKENCFEIDSSLNSIWSPIEPTVAYIRNGDSEEMISRLKSHGFEVKNHLAGYRSIHYVVESTPLRRKIIAEIQVRTIFEEGWSEIDHKIRYPNFSDNALVAYFLEIFNRMAGSADDMGGFVLGLVATLSELENQIALTKKEKESTYESMEQALGQLEKAKKQDAQSKESLATLKAEIEKLKMVTNGHSVSNVTNLENQPLTGLLGQVHATKDLASSSTLFDALRASNNMSGSSALAEALKASKNMSGSSALAEALKASKNMSGSSALAEALKASKNMSSSSALAEVLKASKNIPDKK